MTGSEVNIDGQSLLCVLDHFLWVAGQAMGVGQVQQEVDFRRFGFQRLGKCFDGFLRFASLVVGFGGVDRLVNFGLALARCAR